MTTKPPNDDLFDLLTRYFLQRLDQASSEADGKAAAEPMDPRELAEIRKHAESIKKLGMGQPGSAQAALQQNIQRAIDEKRLKIADDEEAA